MKLYKDLLKKIKNNEHEGKVTLENLTYALNKQPDEILEMVQVLIIHHATIHNHHISDGMMYHGKFYNNGKGMVYGIHHLPEEIVQIVIAYLNCCPKLQT